jgi:hypothetical protein
VVNGELQDAPPRMWLSPEPRSGSPIKLRRKQHRVGHERSNARPTPERQT